MGYTSYRILHQELAEQFNFFRHEKDSRQTDFVISEFMQPEFKQCSLDLVNAVANLAYMDPEEARALDFSTAYFHSRS